LCYYLKVNRSSYYKWLKERSIEKAYKNDRQHLIDIVTQIHKERPSYGYRRINAMIKNKIGWIVSNNYVHHCCKYLCIKSKVKRYRWSKPKAESILYKNIIHNDWSTTRPMEKIVSDMTCIPFKHKLYNLTFYMDAFNNEILSYKLSDRNGDVMTYYDGLKDLLNKLKGQSQETILHTDQGAVYSSRMFTDIHKDYNIIRSMSRAGTPTDNPKIESINGWIKEEMYTDFQYFKENNLFDFIDKFIYYYNNERPAYALNYKTPIQYKTELGF
jgi:transposase InsO family protein